MFPEYKCRCSASRFAASRGVQQLPIILLFVVYPTEKGITKGLQSWLVTVMANIQPEQIEQLQQLLSDYHSGHEREHGAIHECREQACVEAKLGLRYLEPRAQKDAPQGS